MAKELVVSFNARNFSERAADSIMRGFTDGEGFYTFASEGLSFLFNMGPRPDNFSKADFLRTLNEFIRDRNARAFEARDTADKLIIAVDIVPPRP